MKQWVQDKQEGTKEISYGNKISKEKNQSHSENHVGRFVSIQISFRKSGLALLNEII